jgi:hypothetical protein
VAGPLVSFIVVALERTTIYGGLSALGSALYGMGIPKHSVIDYEDALKANKFLLLVHGATAESSRAKEILRKTGNIEIWQPRL